MITLSGDCQIADKFDFDTDDGHMYMVKVEDIGLSKSLVVPKELYNQLPSSEELKHRSMTGDAMLVEIKGVLKTNAKGWNPTLAELEIKSTGTAKRSSLKDRLSSTDA